MLIQGPGIPYGNLRTAPVMEHYSGVLVLTCYRIDLTRMAIRKCAFIPHSNTQMTAATGALKCFSLFPRVALRCDREEYVYWHIHTGDRVVQSSQCPYCQASRVGWMHFHPEILDPRALPHPLSKYSFLPHSDFM